MLKKFTKNIDQKRLKAIVCSLQALSLSPTIYFIYLCFIGTATKEQLNFWALCSIISGALFLGFMMLIIKILSKI